MPSGLVVALSRRFNPRTREGCDGHRFYRDRVRIGVSIHAPVKGATGSGVDGTESYQGFNPRTREGCDRSKRIRSYTGGCFNPRTREGCDNDAG